jgi:Ca2+-binding EF-hand superfamily protein
MGMLGATMSLFASQNAEALFDAKCAMCHMKTPPADKSTMVAPPLSGVMMHVKMRYPKKNESVAFIVDYAQNPDRKKAVCMKQRISHFGLMPSQKENISPDELKKVAKWMYENYPKSNFRGMMMQRKASNNGNKKFLQLSNIKNMNGMNCMKNRPTFAMFDTNGDGVISKKEFHTFQNARMAKMRNKRQRNGGRCSGMMKKGRKNSSYFARFDLNKDGVITKEEFLKVRAAKQAKRKADGMPMRNAKNAPSFESIDSNGDGKITQKEFMDFQMKRRMKRMSN